MAIFDLISREGFVVAPAPPGVTPNFNHPESNGGMYMAGTLTTLCVAFIFVVLRLKTKVFMAGRKLKWDDDKCYRSTSHSSDNTSVSPVLIVFALNFRIYDLLPHRINVNADLLVQPRRCSVWDQPPPGKKAVCLDGYVTGLAIGALNLFTDIIILVLPMSMLYTLQLSRRRKLGLAEIFAIGGFAVGATLARNVEIAVKLKDSDADQTWDVMYEAVWISIKLNVTIICSCLLVCPQLFRDVLTNTKAGQSLRSLFGSTRTTQDSASRGSLSGFNR
ncbi:hypothetical protein BOTCAL_0241g00060 [Botryotinia calthae]|uniref:Rhodopsin domain-containing protein n=1 Tax=Botryotinia calthae TaxID=38488 RepID=A0A4Y8CXW9_9HELO|nr:hypothetical protein BOTCAL_0241g00060 [Botryotinia calthae]